MCVHSMFMCPFIDVVGRIFRVHPGQDRECAEKLSFILAGWEDRSDIFEAIYQTFDLEFARKHGTVCEGSPISRR